MTEKIAGSFRDPSGFLFKKNSTLYRQVNQTYQKDYDLLMASGLYERLTKSGAMVSHQEVGLEASSDPDKVYKIIKPKVIDFISYPYEWCFTQLKEAALLTLAIARRSLDYDIGLKDASAYNVQFLNGRAVFIDTLSFEAYKEGEPWIAYRQFCQHFLAPLALMVYQDIRLNQMLRVNIDGIPLDIASKLLPFKTRLNFGLLTHIHMHAKSQKRYANKYFNERYADANVSKRALIGLMDSLKSTVNKLKITSLATEWTDYYQDTNYSSDAFTAKKDIIKTFISKVDPKSVWDLGANTGEFSRITSEQGIMTVAIDIDPGAVIQNYYWVKTNKEKNILPLIMDLTNPSPSLGWHHQERASFIDRGPVDLVMALALVHHLAIGNNVPLRAVSNFLADLSQKLIIEFVPKSDSQVKRLLSSRQDIFPDYTKSGFEAAFKYYFKTIFCEQVPGSERFIYLMEKKEK